jgi:hypothetical protein
VTPLRVKSTVVVEDWNPDADTVMVYVPKGREGNE